ncbi:hypothetical protein ACHAXS_003495 [Conticribra weissflogii]
MEGKRVLSKQKPIDKLKVSDLEKLLLWHQIPRKEMGKNKSDKLMTWKRIVYNELDLPPTCNRWCSVDEAELVELKENLRLHASRTRCLHYDMVMPMSLVLRHMGLDELQSLENCVRKEKMRRMNDNVGLYETGVEKISKF